MMGVVGKKVIEKWIAMLLSLLCFLPAVSQNAQTKIEGTIVDVNKISRCLLFPSLLKTLRKVLLPMKTAIFLSKIFSCRYL